MSNGEFQFVPYTGTTSYGSPDANNGYTSENNGSGSATFAYDGNRNMKFDGYNALSYDAENRVVLASNAVASG